MLPGLDPLPDQAPCVETGLEAVDHFAVCVEPGQLKPTAEFYVTTLDFDIMFAERIVVGAQAMDSMVVQSKSRAVTLTVIEPDLSGEPGQIDQFLKDHGGAGVQHIAFTAKNIVETIGLMGRNGVEFLSAPDTYYDMVAERLVPGRYSMAQLRDLGILIDEDQDGQLLQIFAKSVHPRRTLFYEVIERLGARSFGSGNIKALYAAVQRHMEQDTTPRKPG
jgi:4-hydroxymandelate synthase